jgi:hypothetical protein
MIVSWAKKNNQKYQTVLFARVNISDPHNHDRRVEVPGIEHQIFEQPDYDCYAIFLRSENINRTARLRGIQRAHSHACSLTCSLVPS